MNQLDVRTDDPEDMREQLATAEDDGRIVVRVPVLVSDQDSRSVAASVREGIFICEQLALDIRDAAASTESDPNDPNGELIVLVGTIADVRGLREFVKEWFDVLNPDGDREPFDMTSEEAGVLYDRLEGEELSSSFRFPVLVEWYRDVRAHFENWNENWNEENSD